MTHSFTTLQQLAAEAVANYNQLAQLQPHLIEYVANIVDLRTIADEPALIQQAHLTLNQTIINASHEQFDSQYEDLLQDAADLIHRVDGVLALIGPALSFLESQTTDDEWTQYYVSVCMHALQVLGEIKDRCQVFIGDFQNYQPEMQNVD